MNVHGKITFHMQVTDGNDRPFVMYCNNNVTCYNKRQ